MLKTTVIFSNDTIIINSKYRAKFVMEREHTSTFFGNYSVIGDIYMDILNRNGCDISDSISYIRLVNYCDSDFDTFDGFSFDFAYQTANDQTLVDAMHKWAALTNINVGKSKKTGGHITGTRLVQDKKEGGLHDSHIHWGPNKKPIIKTINLK